MGRQPALDTSSCPEAGRLPDGPGRVATTQLATFVCTWLGRTPRPRHRGLLIAQP